VSNRKHKHVNLKEMVNSLDEVSEELKVINNRREKILKESRDAIAFSAKAIVALHMNNLKEAEHCIKSTSTILLELRGVAQDDLHKYLIQPETEYVEALAFNAVVSGKTIPNRKKLGVSGAAYLLGLLDAVGEIKRMVYDTIRSGSGEEALSLFNLMEQIYIQVYPYAVYDHVAPGLKRKLDVARILIEDARSIVTEEARRTVFSKTIEELSRKLPSSVQ
jgi:translin